LSVVRFVDDPPSRTQLDLAAESTVCELHDALVQLAIAPGAHAADDKTNADFARETFARVNRKLERELKQFKEMVSIR
jgi:hypothetical protein